MNNQNNICIGMNAGDHITTASRCILIGRNAGKSVMTENDVIITGDDIDIPAPGRNGYININGVEYSRDQVPANIAEFIRDTIDEVLSLNTLCALGARVAEQIQK